MNPRTRRLRRRRRKMLRTVREIHRFIFKTLEAWRTSRELVPQTRVVDMHYDPVTHRISATFVGRGL